MLRGIASLAALSASPLFIRRTWKKIYDSEARNNHRDSQENLAKLNRRREGLGVDKMDNQLGDPHYREILNTMEKSLI